MSERTDQVMAGKTSDARVYSIPRIARWLGISPNHAYALANADPPPFPVLRLGRRLIVPAAAFDHWLETGGKVKA